MTTFNSNHFATFFRDTCLLIPPAAGSVDDYNLPVKSSVYDESTGVETECRFYSAQAMETQLRTRVDKSEARMRLPHGVAVSKESRVRVTHVDGTQLSPSMLYRVKGPVLPRGHSQILSLELVTNE